jgi:rubrerythrin
MHEEKTMSTTAPQTVFEFALKMEADGERFYRALAADCKDRDIRRIFNSLADDELRHSDALRKLEQDVVPTMKRTTVLTDARHVFADMARQAFLAAGQDETALYRQALAMESSSRDLYQAQASQTKSKPARKIFLLLAQEEERHRFLIEVLSEFASGPEAWLRRAEYERLDDNWEPETET